MFFGRKKRKTEEFPSFYNAHQKGGEVEDFVYGKVWGRIWRNRSMDGKIYYRVTFDRLQSNQGFSKISKSFGPSDLDDVMRAVQRAAAFLATRNERE